MRQVVIQYRVKRVEGVVSLFEGGSFALRSSLIVENNEQIEDYLKTIENYDSKSGYKIKTDCEVVFPIVLGQTGFWTE